MIPARLARPKNNDDLSVELLTLFAYLRPSHQHISWGHMQAIDLQETRDAYSCDKNYKIVRFNTGGVGKIVSRHRTAAFTERNKDT